MPTTTACSHSTPGKTTSRLSLGSLGLQSVRIRTIQATFVKPAVQACISATPTDFTASSRAAWRPRGPRRQWQCHRQDRIDDPASPAAAVRPGNGIAAVRFAGKDGGFAIFDDLQWTRALPALPRRRANRRRAAPRGPPFLFVAAGLLFCRGGSRPYRRVRQALETATPSSRGGRGGNATLYGAFDKDGRRVAIKCCIPSYGLGRRRSFPARDRWAAKLDHPHIAPLLDSGETDYLLWFVMRSWRARRCGR